MSLGNNDGDVVAEPTHGNASSNVANGSTTDDANGSWLVLEDRTYDDDVDIDGCLVGNEKMSRSINDGGGVVIGGEKDDDDGNDDGGDTADSVDGLCE